MPTTRRSTGNTRPRTGPTKGQSTLSFHGKVTKNVSSDAKKDVSSPTVTKVKPRVEQEPTKEVEDVVKAETEEESEEESEPGPESPKRSEAELKAEKITDAQINKYWKSIEKQRIAPQIHQEGITSNEKVLRYFDVSSQYGPCIGIERMKRWQRADRLGLNPPIEVLAVLLKESKGNKDSQKAQMDKIMSSIAAGAGS